MLSVVLFIFATNTEEHWVVNGGSTRKDGMGSMLGRGRLEFGQNRCSLPYSEVTSQLIVF